VAPGLTSDFITETAERTSKVFTAYIAGKFQAGMTSSLTIWSRMILGFLDRIEVTRDRSRIFILRSSRESASAKIEKPSALAW
jgi:hypothetical protein